DVIGRALISQPCVRFAGNALAKSRRKSGFADARLTRDEHDLPLALPGETLAFQQEMELVPAADEIGQTCRADRLEAALGSRRPLDHPRRDRLGNSLDLVLAEIAQTEQIAEQPARGGGDDDRPRLGQGLKAGCKIRRLADQSMLAQRNLAA